MKAKTFVTDDYQVTRMDDDGPDNCRESTFTGGSSLSSLSSILETLYEALKLVYEQEEPEYKVKEVSNNNFDRVKTFDGYGTKEVYAKINDYAISHNLRIVSCSEPEMSIYDYYTITVIFDKL